MIPSQLLGHFLGSLLEGGLSCSIGTKDAKHPVENRLGFAGALASYVDRSELLLSVGSLNLGVELAQISLLALAWLLTLKWHETPAFEKVRVGGSLVVALAGGFWAVTRLAE